MTLDEHCNSPEWLAAIAIQVAKAPAITAEQGHRIWYLLHGQESK